MCQFTAYGSEAYSARKAQTVAAELLTEVERRWRCGDFISPVSAAGEPITPVTGTSSSSLERAEEPPRIVVHIMSNNGAHIYAAILHHARQDHSWLLQGLRGIVYDCSPGSLSASIFTRAFLANKPPIALRMLVLGSPLALLLLALWTGRRHFLPTFAGLVALFLLATRAQQVWTERYIQELASDPSTCPLLCLYTQADDLVPAAVIEDFAARRRARGVQVSTRRWESTAHMALLKENHKEYSEALGKFLGSLGL